MSNVTPSTDDGGTATIAVGGVVIALALIFVVLRFYIRIISKAGLWWDDWLIAAAVVSTLATAALLLWGNSIDPDGEWVSDNTDANYIYTPQDMFYLKLSYVTSILYFTIAGSTKLGILLMYNRLFSVSDAFRRQLFITSALVIGWWIGCTVANLTNCIPLDWSWRNGLADPRYCFNYNIFWMAAGACEVLIDVLILAIPIRVVLRLQLSLQKRLTILCVFLLGGFVVVTGLVKCILGYVPGSRVPSYSRTEVWTTVHTGMAIVCACLPIMKPLIVRIATSAWASKLSSFSLRQHIGSLRERSSLSASNGAGTGTGAGRRQRIRSRSGATDEVGLPFVVVGESGDDILLSEQKVATTYTERVENEPRTVSTSPPPRTAFLGLPSLNFERFSWGYRRSQLPMTLGSETSVAK